MEIIVSDMARQEDVTEALKAADQMEWVRRMNSIRKDVYKRQCTMSWSWTSWATGKRHCS